MHKKHFLAVACGALALVLIAGFSGYAIGRNTRKSSSGAETSDASVQISVEKSDDPDENRTISCTELRLPFDGMIYYSGISQVNIQVGGAAASLEDALKSGAITAEALIADIRLDAENGVCKESASSENGLSRFLYQYRDFEVEIIYDVYETPAKGAHIIREIFFSPLGQSSDASYAYPDEDAPGEYLDREDWGISLEASSVSSSGIVLKCAQSGGQQLGTLYAEYFVLFCDGEPVSGQVLSVDCGRPITMGGYCELTLDWSDTYGTLPSGHYMLSLFIRDKYDESQVHPLMRNFYDVQIYRIEFTIS